jgi:hypothetical protein
MSDLIPRGKVKSGQGKRSETVQQSELYKGKTLIYRERDTLNLSCFTNLLEMSYTPV